MQQHLLTQEFIEKQIHTQSWCQKNKGESMKKIMLSAAIIAAIIMTMFVYNVQAKTEDTFINHGNFPKNLQSERPVISHDGKYFALIGDSKVRIYDVNGNQTGTFIDPDPYINPPNEWKFWNPNRIISAIAFLPDNRHLAVAVHQRKINIITLAGKIIKTIDVPVQKMSPESGGWSYIDDIIYFPDGKKLITFESADTDIIVRDANYNLLKRINLKHGTMAYEFTTIKVTPDGKNFITLQNFETPSADGWTSILKLFDENGNFIRDLENDKPGSIATEDGKFKKVFIKPLNFNISNDGKYVIYKNTYFHMTVPDPLGRKIKKYGREYPMTIIHKIRRTEIATGKQFETWITEDKDIGINEVAFTSDDKNIIAVDLSSIYTISFKGEILSTFKNENVKYTDGDKELSYPFQTSSEIINSKTNAVLAYCTSPKSGIIYYNFKGKPLTYLIHDNLEPKKISVSHNGEFISFEFEKFKQSYLFDVRKNTITTENASIFFDNKNKEQRISYLKDETTRKDTTVLSLNGKSEKYPEYDPRYIVILPNNQFAETYSGFTLFDSDGEAIRRYPNCSISQDIAVDPLAKYYVSPSTSAKYKEIYLFDFNGKNLKKWYLGAFFTYAYCFSPDGSLIAGGHDNVGYLQIWDTDGKLLHRFSNIHSGQISGIGLINNKFLVSSEEDGNIVITNLETKEFLNISLYSNEKFIASDSSGRFDCSEEMEDRVTIFSSGNISERKKQTEGLVWKFLQEK